jgi:hypothetical protein
MTSAGLGAVTGGVGGRLLTGYSRSLSIGTKGWIGESLSVAWNRLQGSRMIAVSNTKIVGRNLTTRINSQCKSIRGVVYYVESKFGTFTLSSAQRTAQSVLADSHRVERWEERLEVKLGLADETFSQGNS